MANSAPLEVKLDIARGKAYASRNYNDLRHLYEKWGVDRSQVDWQLQLRQQRQPAAKFRTAVGEPTLTEPRKKPAQTKEPQEGPYEQQTFGNTATSGHMLRRIGDPVQTTNIRPQCKEQVCWQMNLRNSAPTEMGRFDNKPWRRFHTKGYVSFDRMGENIKQEIYAGDGPTPEHKHITPQDRRPDRSNSALPIATLRDGSDYCIEGVRTKMRYPGCEGTALQNWRHLIHPGKVRDMIKFECTLHEMPDNRSDACLVDMLGKKKWQYCTAKDRDTLGPEYPDPKLEYMQVHPPILGEPYKRDMGYVGDTLSKSVKSIPA